METIYKKSTSGTTGSKTVTNTTTEVSRTTVFIISSFISRLDGLNKEKIRLQEKIDSLQADIDGFANAEVDEDL
jgi:hypothetical protein